MRKIVFPPMNLHGPERSAVNVEGRTPGTGIREEYHGVGQTGVLLHAVVAMRAVQEYNPARARRKSELFFVSPHPIRQESETL